MDFGFLEEYGHIVFPVLGILVLVLLGAAVVAAWRNPEMDGVEKARLKGEIIRQMRQNIGWITAAELAERLDLDAHTVAVLLEEMREDGVVVTGMMENLLHYRLKGT
ncbi:MAG: winged helix-turn-helix domain-containing protein [Deltaproteobacteria bacterium]|nr:MAG: winged helix-turn-helix domain-containing protein [Deltaproteobacteria bacterium]